ncbi:26S proteasome regulatory subunit RPN6 [Hanseniaspora osmophila]|uniref:26S proteasome regulatory subunit RPN6 n=1 Tax=Hanseniaspora osmophila TaxID=56408 RepID=A0A1E5RP02_9ASCO|nr:26S proteasome regulatory subunit RPN6 [Hanseniaspora osmophila]
MSLEQADTYFQSANTYPQAIKEYTSVFQSNKDKILTITSSNAVSSAISKILQEQEHVIIKLGELYGVTQNLSELIQLIEFSKEFMMTYAKSKIAKILKVLIDDFEMIPDSIDAQIKVIEESIDFADKHKRIFLKNSLSIKLANLYYDKQQYSLSLNLINTLLRNFKKLDDKSSLVDIHLLESKVYHKLRNMPKAKAALTSARTAANSIYCSSATMAELDMISGTLHCEDKDYKTAYSYFFESFDAFHNDSTKSTSALKSSKNNGNKKISKDRSNKLFVKSEQVLKYMLLCKIMLNLIDDVNQILNAKYTKEIYQSKSIDAMKTIAEAYSDRSLLEFNKALKIYETELKTDDLIRSHLNALYDALLESNLSKIIEPFDCVEISHISNLIGLDYKQVEGKLSQMILDKVFNGVLDQGNGWLNIYGNEVCDPTYDSSLELIGNLNKVVEQLFEKAGVLQ